MAPIKTEPRKIVSEVFDLVEENVQTTEDLERRKEKEKAGWADLSIKDILLLRSSSKPVLILNFNKNIYNFFIIYFYL